MNKLVILTGPTAVGKTSLSIELAHMINGEIISADSMQVYKYMDIGTAKVTKSEMQDVKHYLIDCLEPTEEFHVVKFKEMVLKAMDEIYKKGKIPILCGGTGFYIQAILYDIDFTEKASDEKFKKELEDYAENFGNDALWERLEAIDIKSAQNIPAANRKRVIRALEYYHLTGEKFSTHNSIQKEKNSPYNYAYFVLNDDRQLLYNRIDKRVDKMIADGLVDEVKNLLKIGCHKGMTSMDGIGYKEIIDYLNGNCNLQEATEAIKQGSRRYAKRQLTWFRREKDCIWLDRKELSTDEAILAEIKKNLKAKGII